MFSQYDEEKYILEAVMPVGGLPVTIDVTGEGWLRPSIAPGRFLDIGGWHPVIFSNTRALVEIGWEGVIVEPSPGPFINFLRGCVKCGNVPKELYGDRHLIGGLKPCDKCGSSITYGTDCGRFTLIQAGVGLEPGLTRFHATDDAVSTSGEAEREKWQKVGGYFGSFMCPIISLEQIANQFGGFDFVNFDAEGVSVDLFKRAMEIGWRPRCCCVEHDGRLTELLAGAPAYNAVYVNETNVVLVKK